MYATAATKQSVLDAVIAKLKLDTTTTELAKHVRADAPLDSTLLTVAVQDPDPARAAAIANELADQLIAASPSIQGQQVATRDFIDSEIAATQAQIVSTEAQAEALGSITDRTAKQDSDLDTLNGRLASLRSTLATYLSVSSANASNLLTVWNPAPVPIDAVSPNRLQNTFLAAALALILAGGVVFVAEHLYDGVRDADAVQEVAGLSTFGTIVKMRGEKGRSEIYRLATILYPHSTVAEAYRTLRTNIEFSSVDTPIRTLLVTSSTADEGKTVTAANLAVVFAQAGKRVLLVDADLRKPGVHRLFDLSNTHGLTTLLRNDSASLDAIAQPTEQDNLRVLTTGPLPANPAELAGSQRMRTVIDQPEVRNRPRHPRQPSPPKHVRRRHHRIVRRRDPIRHRRPAESSAVRAHGTGVAGEDGRQRAGCRPQPRPHATCRRPECLRQPVRRSRGSRRVRSGERPGAQPPALVDIVGSSTLGDAVGADPCATKR